MKKTILIALLTLFSVVCFAQDGGPLKFLGIPIDGTEAQFIAKLKAKGFIYNNATEGYKGQFNGKKVDVFIHTNHALVDRVYVAFPYTNESGIRMEFNRLLGQFNDTGKYMDLSMNKEIPEDDDISYEITVNDKRYQASFSYFDPDRDPQAFSDALLEVFSNLLTDEQMAILKEYARKMADASDDDKDAIQAQMTESLQSMVLGQEAMEEPDLEKAFLLLVSIMDRMRSLADGNVWFMIHESYGRYQIGLYYDNLHNQAHGEDL